MRSMLMSQLTRAGSANGGGDAARGAVVVGHSAGAGRPGALPPPRARQPRPLRRRVPVVARRRAAAPAPPAAARAPGRHLLQPPLQRALPLPRLRLRRLQDRLRPLARLPARRRLLGGPLRQGHRDAPCARQTWSLFIGLGHSQTLVCQPGASSWSVRAYDETKRFEDMAFYQGKLYALADDENLLVVNISQDQSTGDPQVSRIGLFIKGDPFYTVVYPDDTMARKKLYLVESRGTLLMIRRKIWCWCRPAIHTPGVTHDIVAGRNEFEIFKADFEKSRWVSNVTTVGDDQVLFLGRRCSRAVSVSQYGMSGDQIFFLDDEEENTLEYSYEEESTSCSAYDMRDGEVSSPLPRVSWKRCDEMRLAAWLFPQD